MPRGPQHQVVLRASSEPNPPLLNVTMLSDSIGMGTVSASISPVHGFREDTMEIETYFTVLISNPISLSIETKYLTCLTAFFLDKEKVIMSCR